MPCSGSSVFCSVSSCFHSGLPLSSGFCYDFSSFRGDSLSSVVTAVMNGASANNTSNPNNPSESANMLCQPKFDLLTLITLVKVQICFVSLNLTRYQQAAWVLQQRLPRPGFKKLRLHMCGEGGQLKGGS
jgi:hypothetical protein